MRRAAPGLAVLISLLAGAPVAIAHDAGSGYTHLGPHRVGPPDLRADAPDGLMLDSSGNQVANQLLLRFNGYIYNSHTGGTLEIHGTDRSDGSMSTVRQRIYTGTGATWNDVEVPGAQLDYAPGDGHRHWHLNAAARYSLVAADGDALVAPSAKVGFCAIDSQSGYALSPRRYTPYIPTEWSWEDDENAGHGNCGDRAPEADQTVMGLTPGWRDLYSGNLWDQWIDISNVLPGTYRVRNEVDPLDYVIESDEVNPPADAPVTIPGYLANPVTVSGLSTVDPSAIALDVDYVSSELATKKAPQFRIVEPPEHGTLDVDTNEWAPLDADAPTVRYTPAGDAPGTDSFEYEVREGNSVYPRSPSRASVGIALTGPTPPAEQVLISGSADALVTGTSRKLSAEVTHPRGTGAVSWHVEGVPGGNQTVGTIAPDGLYVAPVSVPADDTVDITATSDRGVTATTTIRITAPIVRVPQPTTEPLDEPTVDAEPQPDRGDAGGDGGAHSGRPSRTPVPISGLKVIRDGKYVIASFLPGRSGKARTELLRRKKRVGRCSARVTAGRRYTCRIVLRRRTPTKKLKVRVVARRSDGRGVVVRSARVRAVRASARHRHR